MLNAIERATSKKIELMELTSTELINDKRIAQFKQAIPTPWRQKTSVCSNT